MKVLPSVAEQGDFTAQQLANLLNLTPPKKLAAPYPHTDVTWYETSETTTKNPRENAVFLRIAQLAKAPLPQHDLFAIHSLYKWHNIPALMPYTNEVFYHEHVAATLWIPPPSPTKSDPYDQLETIDVEEFKDALNGPAPTLTDAVHSLIARLHALTQDAELTPTRKQLSALKSIAADLVAYTADNKSPLYTLPTVLLNDHDNESTAKLLNHPHVSTATITEFGYTKLGPKGYDRALQTITDSQESTSADSAASDTNEATNEARSLLSLASTIRAATQIHDEIRATKSTETPTR